MFWMVYLLVAVAFITMGRVFQSIANAEDEWVLSEIAQTVAYGSYATGVLFVVCAAMAV